jgi:hypothetical protein
VVLAPATVFRAAIGEHAQQRKDQLRGMERAREEKAAHGEIETAHPGYLGAQDTYYVGTIKGVGRIYQQTFLDTYAKESRALRRRAARDH